MRFPLRSLTYFERGRGNLKIKYNKSGLNRQCCRYFLLKTQIKQRHLSSRRRFFSKNTACLSTRFQKTPKHLTFARLAQGPTLYSAIVFIRLSAWMHKQRQKTNQGQVVFAIFEGENGKYACTAMPSHPHSQDTQLNQIFLSFKQIK